MTNCFDELKGILLSLKNKKMLKNKLLQKNVRESELL